ncbi:MAG: hypothetical protein EKK64_04985 [Neisseriaceae bacterium]|nr:MAG: hypothetical protein EKK64_04985 [Neisseriaceae bacterium]
MTRAPDEIACALLNHFFSDYKVYRGYQNEVKYPNKYIVAAITNTKALGTPLNKYDPVKQIKTISQLLGADIQADVYGESASVDAAKLQALLWSDLASNYLQERFNVGVLQVQQIQNLTDTFDSENYLPRYVITFTLSYYSDTEYNQDSANELSGFKLHNIDVDFKSEE